MKAERRCGRGGMADALDLGSSAARRGGSSPLARTIRKIKASGIPEAILLSVSVMKKVLQQFFGSGCDGQQEWQDKWQTVGKCTKNGTGMSKGYSRNQ